MKLSSFSFKLHSIPFFVCLRVAIFAIFAKCFNAFCMNFWGCLFFFDSELALNRASIRLFLLDFLKISGLVACMFYLYCLDWTF